jgi:hypothetical protein
MSVRSDAPDPVSRRGPGRPRARARRLAVGFGLAVGSAVSVWLVPLLALAVVRGDPSSHLSSGDSASEYWDIVAHFDSNHDLFARFLITNEGPGERTAVATWQLIDPNGKRTEFRNGRRRQRWTLSADGDRIKIGSSIFDQSGAVHRLEYDSTKRGIRVAFEYSPAGPVGWAGPATDVYPFDLLELETPVTGTIWLEGMSEALRVKGTITVSHTWMQESEADLALRRIDFSSTGGEPALYFSDRTSPSGERERWLAIARDGDLLYQTSDFGLALAHSAGADRSDYPTPSELRISGSGIEGVVQIGAVLAEINPLEAIPQPFRFLLSFKLRPHRVWARASFEARLLAGQNNPETVLKGSGVTTITFTNPLPPKLMKPGN